MGWLVVLISVLARVRNGGWKPMLIPAVWVIAWVLVINSLSTTAAQVLGITVMGVGAWWLSDWSMKRAPAS